MMALLGAHHILHVSRIRVKAIHVRALTFTLTLTLTNSSHSNNNNLLILKLHFLNAISQNSDMFRHILIIFMVLATKT
jgi:hypothetical protein